MNDQIFQFFTTFDHKLKDRLNKNDSRFSQSDESCSNMCSDQEFLQFRPNTDTQNVESDDSGVCSPPLWKNSQSPSRSSSQPLLSYHVYRSLSPTARLQAIVSGQKELMEMVKNMPESSYELSLKDLVEHHGIEAQTPPLNGQDMQHRGAVKSKGKESKKSEKNLVRNGSFEMEIRGLFLKMVFLFPLQSKKKRNLYRSFRERVSSKAKAAKCGGGGCDNERDWWKKKFTGWSDSDSNGMSTNRGGGCSSRSSSGGSSSDRNYGGGRKNDSLPTSCWPLFRFKNNK